MSLSYVLGVAEFTNDFRIRGKVGTSQFWRLYAELIFTTLVFIPLIPADSNFFF